MCFSYFDEDRGDLCYWRKVKKIDWYGPLQLLKKIFYI